MRLAKKIEYVAMLLIVAIMLIPNTTFATSTDGKTTENISAATNGITINSSTTQEKINEWAGEDAMTIENQDGVYTVTLLKDFKLGKLHSENTPEANTPIYFGGTGSDYSEYKDNVFILDLNGHIIESDTMVVNSGCNLTIKDSIGTGKIYMNTAQKQTAAYEAIVNQKKLTIESGTFEAVQYGEKTTVGVVGSAVAGVETVINGGVFKGNNSALNFSSGITVVNGGKFESTSGYGVVVRNTAVVNFPEGSTAEFLSEGFPIVIGKIGENTGKIEISSGTFTSETATSLVGKFGDADVKASVKITGGKFTQDPTEFTDEGQVVVQIGKPYIVGQNFIEKASSEVKAGDKIVVKKGEVVLSNIPGGVEVFVDENAKAIVNNKTIGPTGDSPHITETPSIEGGYFPPIITIQKPVIEIFTEYDTTKDGAKVTLSADGTSITIEVLDGYELTDVTVNGVSKGAVTKVTGLKTGDKVIVSTKKLIDEKETRIAKAKATKLIARSQAVKTKSGKKAIKVYWFAKEGSLKNLDGVQIFRSTKRADGTYKKVFTSKSGKYINTAVKKGQMYYYKVRGYVRVDGKLYFTKYSTKAWRRV